MILSQGKNQFKDNVFSFWEWSAPILQTPEEVILKARELRLAGRVVKNIVAVGMGYNWNEIGIGEATYHAMDILSEEERKKVPNPDALIPQGLRLNCAAEIDEPLLIEFEDGDVLAISFDEGSSVRMGLNDIPMTIEPGINCKTFHASRLFKDIIGRTLVDVKVSSVLEEPEFTGSHGLSLDEQPSYICSLELIYDSESRMFPRRRLHFEPWYDYGWVELIDHDGQTLTFPSEELPWIIEGYLNPQDFEEAENTNKSNGGNTSLPVGCLPTILSVLAGLGLIGIVIT